MGRWSGASGLRPRHAKRLEAAHKRIAELERSAGRADILAGVVERQMTTRRPGGIRPSRVGSDDTGREFVRQ